MSHCYYHCFAEHTLIYKKYPDFWAAFTLIFEGFSEKQAHPLNCADSPFLIVQTHSRDSAGICQTHP